MLLQNQLMGFALMKSIMQTKQCDLYAQLKEEW